MPRAPRIVSHWILAAFALVVLIAAVRPTAVRARDAEPLAIVVNRSNPLSEISLADLRKLYRGQRSRWSNGRRVTLVMRDPGTPEREAILQTLYGVDEDAYRRGFLQAVFTGAANGAPRVLASPNGVLRFVFNVPGAIGYVRASEVDATVKTLRVDGRLPGEAGYRLEVPEQ
jgi:ABC-type phosphate transport system substrate-binding protein